MTSPDHLTLNKKIQFVHDNSSGSLQRVLAKKYNILLGSVSNILKRTEEYVHDYQINQNQDVVYSQQPQLYKLVSELESKLIDVYIHSNKKKTNYYG